MKRPCPLQLRARRERTGGTWWPHGPKQRRQSSCARDWIHRMQLQKKSTDGKKRRAPLPPSLSLSLSRSLLPSCTADSSATAEERNTNTSCHLTDAAADSPSSIVIITIIICFQRHFFWICSCRLDGHRLRSSFFFFLKRRGGGAATIFFTVESIDSSDRSSRFERRPSCVRTFSHHCYYCCDGVISLSDGLTVTPTR